MSTSKLMRIILLIICYFTLFAVFAIGETFAATYYIAPNGSNGNAGSVNSPWATFAYAQSRMSAGDTLILKDGTYHDSLIITKSGASGKPITFKAQNDGSAIVDGDYSRTPFEIDNKNHIIVEGIYFKESDSHVIDIDGADNLVFRRVTASDAKNPENNYHVWRLDAVTNSLFEDCAGWGNGRNIVLIYKPSANNTLRRFWMQYHDKQTSQPPACMQVYGANNNLLENIICTYSGQGSWGRPSEFYLSGAVVWDNNQSSTYNNDFYGCVSYDLNMTTYNAPVFGSYSKSYESDGNSFTNIVAINNRDGFMFNNNSSLPVTNATIVNMENGILHRDNNDYGGADAINLKNSIIMDSDCGWKHDDTPDGSSISHTYNTFYNNRTNFCNESQHATENNTNPKFDTATYGYGAYLMRPSALNGLGENGTDIGAEVLYRYENGVLTDIPLWPWPMEDRIYKELGVSVTYETKGGLWKTLENVYSSTPLQLPSSPTGLRIMGD